MEEIWSDKSVHILVDILTKWLGHTKAMSRHRNRPRYGTVIYFFLRFLEISCNWSQLLEAACIPLLVAPSISKSAIVYLILLMLQISDFVFCYQPEKTLLLKELCSRLGPPRGLLRSSDWYLNYIFFFFLN